MKFQANWRKVDERQIILTDSMLADFMFRLDLNISVLLYDFILKSLDKVIRKVKMIEMYQKNTTEII